jgi:hypothetical protein
VSIAKCRCMCCQKNEERLSDATVLLRHGKNLFNEEIDRLTAERDRYREALRQVGYRAEHMRIDPKATLDDIEGIARESLNPPPKEPEA